MSTTNNNLDSTETVAVSLKGMSVDHWKALKVMALHRDMSLTELVKTLIEDAHNAYSSNKE